MTGPSTNAVSRNTDFFALPPELRPFIAELSRAKYDPSKMTPVILEMLKTSNLGIEDFPLVPLSYSRTMLHREDNGFEIMMARWNKGAVTPIHGHPRFAFVFLIDGGFTETSFIRDEASIVQSKQTQYLSGDYAYEDGIEGRFDNFIHKIFADNDSLSLHIYSDDALKGEIFEI